MKPQIKALTVLERTSHYLKAGVLKEKPAWYDVVGAHPPSIDLSKKPKKIELNQQEIDPGLTILGDKQENQRLYKTRVSDSERKQRNNSIARIPKLKFLEDELRDVFYHQHPWEFARPKILVENEGDDISKLDWSHMLQFTKPLDGESVVQRTLWLLNQEIKEHEESETETVDKKSLLFEAYDKARFEFYRLRMEEEMSSLVSREESSMYGAVYPSTMMDWGVKHEQEYVDVWAKVAANRTQILEASRSRNVATSSYGTDATSGESGESVWETNEDSVPPKQ
ncbi:37S ribosomal protein S25, mitochondrial [Scheffersomyces amazonensis]|uniref:37S ribosomal protein S25, mitochondrial n=1 Tax=Scheffersomyces amazonensis TaxID=1078765 RepID=UPI00315CA181